MNVAEHIIIQFGGLTKLARALGHRHPTTVQGWKKRGFVPAHQQANVLKVASETGVKLDPSDFFVDASQEAAE